jgi:two-component system cell cycle sensor histidine kinase/response regulator CckA
MSRPFPTPRFNAPVVERLGERYLALGRELVCAIGTQDAWLIATAATEVVLGYSGTELGELALEALLHPDDRAPVAAHLAGLRAGARDLGFECRLRRRDGAYRIISWRTGPRDRMGLVLAVGLDRTEESRLEERLRASEARARALADCSPIGVYETDLRGSVVYANDRMQAIWDTGHSALADGSWIEQVHPADAPRLVAWIEDPGGVAAPQEGLCRVVLPDGAVRRVTIRTTPRRDEHGALVGTLGTVEDVTERCTLEEQLRQAQKMEAVGQLAGGVAHDFNNLLTVIKTYSEFMLEQIEDGSPLRADAIEIQKAAGRAAALTRQLLAFSRKQVLVPRSIDLNEIVQGMEPMLRRLIGEDIRIELRVAQRLGAVKADAGQLEQVVMNLVVNARDAMPQGGTLTLETSEMTLTEEMRGNHGVIPGPYISLVVRDTGCGMDRATRARVFEPFFTTKEQGRGTGLGLSTVYGIVKQSEGYIWCDSTEGVGTTFTVYLPLVPAEERTAQPEVDAAPDRGSGVVLVTEDEDSIRALSRRILEREGYTVLEARDGREAIRVAAGYPGRIDLLVTDMVMPNLGGSDLFAHLRLLRPDLRVLFVSGYTDEDMIRRGLKDVGSAFLQKPFTAKALAAAARAAVS